MNGFSNGIYSSSKHPSGPHSSSAPVSTPVQTIGSKKNTLLDTFLQFQTEFDDYRCVVIPTLKLAVHPLL